MTDVYPTLETRYYPQAAEAEDYDDDLAPYASLFLKPFARRKCEFSISELEMMCKDPLHSPRLILYLIDFFKRM
jgi:hypothetical protein